MTLDSIASVLTSEETLDSFIEAFERGAWPKAAWNHAAHIAVAACYLIRHSEEATARVQNGIRHYNQCVGTVNSDQSGYHETLTLFWLAIVKARLGEIHPELPRVKAVRLLVEEFGAQRDLFREYYSFDVVRSRGARREWVAPDLKELP